LKCTLFLLIQKVHLYQGIPQEPGTRQIARLIAFFPSYFVFKNENVKMKIKEGFVLHTGFAGFPLLH
jgi:hypothetical protein